MEVDGLEGNDAGFAALFLLDGAEGFEADVAGGFGVGFFLGAAGGFPIEDFDDGAEGSPI